ncbi:MAG: PAS domain S-box protein [Chloroflexi bacterium]|nr:PAS domain S-box protein [Chloroflexota bacterium]
MLSQRLKILSNPHFWAVLIIFAIVIALHYPQQILSTSSPSLFSFLGLSRHAIERILLLVPVSYAAFVFGTKAGLISLAVAAVIMLPRVFLLSEYLPDALLETIAVILIGGLINLWFDSYRKEKERHQEMLQTLSKLNATDQQLESAYQATRRSEKRLYALNEIAAIVSQSLELEDILSAVVDKVKQVMSLDIVLIFLLDQDKQELKLVTHREVSDEFVAGLKGLKVGEGFNGRVAQTGEPLLIEDASEDPRLTREVVKREGMRSEVIVPLKAKGNVVGTLAGAMRGSRQFLDEEVELLIHIASHVGMAIENTRLYRRERLSAEQALASERRYREIFEGAHDAIWIHDSHGNIIAANKATEELVGYTSKELLRMNVRDFLAEEGLNLARQIRRKLFSGETVEQPYEQRLIRRDGTEAILKLTTNLISEDGKLMGFQNIARDVTREKEMQDKLSAAYRELSESHQRLKESQEQLIQAEKLTSLGQLAASIAHEVNNPLSGVLAYTQLLAKKVRGNNISKDVALDYLSKMEAELTRSTKLIRSLLDFARQSPPTFRQLNLNDVVNRAFELAAHSAELQHIQTVKELDPSLPHLMADFDQLHQVCTNLILNAIQAMPQGGKLTLRTSVSNGQLKIEVQDTGCGISPENMRKLFTPFFTTKHEVKGVGLGLAISYGIIQRHHGRIEVQSKKGKGTTFIIYLPLYHEEPAEKS